MLPILIPVVSEAVLFNHYCLKLTDQIQLLDFMFFKVLTRAALSTILGSVKHCSTTY
jgi:hypothetical protein